MPWRILSTTLPFDFAGIRGGKRRRRRRVTISSPIALHSQSMNLGDFNIASKFDGGAAGPGENEYS